MTSPPQTEELLEALSAGAVDAARGVASMPAYIVDNDLRVRWQNAASPSLVGDLRGRLEVSSKVVPEDLDRARDAFTQKQNGAEHTEVELSVLRCDGTLVRVAVSSVPLKDPAGEMIGSFGLVQVLGSSSRPRSVRRGSAHASARPWRCWRRAIRPPRSPSGWRSRRRRSATTSSACCAASTPAPAWRPSPRRRRAGLV